MKYTYQIGIVRAKETNLLKKTDWNRLLYIPTLKDTWAELVRLNLGYNEVGELEILKSIPEVYSKNIENLYKEISDYLIEQDIKNSFLFEMEVYQAKLSYKKRVFENNLDILQYKNKDLDIDVDFEKIEMTPFEFDVFLDSKLFDFRIRTAKKYKNEFLLRIWKIKIDFYNLKLFVHKDKNFIENGNISASDWDVFRIISNEEILVHLDFWGYKDIFQSAYLGNAVDWELKEEQKILQICDEGILFFETMEPIIAYFFKRYLEIKNLNRLVYGRAFRLPNSKIENQISGM